MGKRYNWDINPFQDFMVRSIMYNVDVADENYEADIYSSFAMILEEIVDDNDIKHLDFEIKMKDNSFKLIGKNAVTALWLTGIFPRDLNFVLKNKVFLIGDRKYKYNKKTYKLTYTIVNE